MTRTGEHAANLEAVALQDRASVLELVRELVRALPELTLLPPV
jgi:hypothetical protein